MTYFDSYRILGVRGRENQKWVYSKNIPSVCYYKGNRYKVTCTRFTKRLSLVYNIY
jgi:hypothetical protein